MPVTSGLYYTVSGGDLFALPPLVLIHGAGSSHLCWPPEIRRMEQYRILTIDLPGHGRSVGSGLQSIEAYTTQLEFFLEALNIYHVILVGHSLGAAIALQAALNNPRRINGLGIVAGGAHFRLPAEILSGLQNDATYSQTLKKMREFLYSPDTPPSWAEKGFNLLQQTRPGVLYGDFLACSRFDVRQRLGEIYAPTWIITGSRDRLTPPASANYMASNIPGADLQIVPGAGHTVMLDAPRLFMQGLARLLQRVNP